MAGKGLAFLVAALAQETDDCIVWPYALTKAGYPVFGVGGRVEYGHRWIAREAHGPAPSPKHEAAHKPRECHNRACVNKRHVRWATRAENRADMRLDDTVALGSRNGHAKLTEEIVATIRSGKAGSRTLSRLYGVNPSVITDAKSGKTWKHVKQVEIL